MDFERVLRELLPAFERDGIRYALIGGFALGALEVPRATADLDFLVHRDDLDRLHSILTSCGYVRAFGSENVSQYGNRDDAWGAVDFLHAWRPVSLAMLQRAIAKPVFEGTLVARVVQPEDVVGLKVQAMVNDPQRRAKETADIEAVAGAYGARLDWRRLLEYYDLFGLRSEWEELQRRYAR